jgi:hypothetical protein
MPSWQDSNSGKWHPAGGVGDSTGYDNKARADREAHDAEVARNQKMWQEHLDRQRREEAERQRQPLGSSSTTTRSSAPATRSSAGPGGLPGLITIMLGSRRGCVQGCAAILVVVVVLVVVALLASK